MTNILFCKYDSYSQQYLIDLRVFELLVTFKSTFYYEDCISHILTQGYYNRSTRFELRAFVAVMTGFDDDCERDKETDRSLSKWSLTTIKLCILTV